MNFIPLPNLRSAMPWLLLLGTALIAFVLAVGAQERPSGPPQYLQMETLKWSLGDVTLTFTVSEWTRDADGTYHRGKTRSPYELNLETYKVIHDGVSSAIPMEEAQHFILLLFNLNDETTGLAFALEDRAKC